MMPGGSANIDKVAEYVAAAPRAIVHVAGEFAADAFIETLAPILIVAALLAPFVFFIYMIIAGPIFGDLDNTPRSLFSYVPAPADSPLRDPQGFSGESTF
jgi:hypothetical protein